MVNTCSSMSATTLEKPCYIMMTPKVLLGICYAHPDHYDRKVAPHSCPSPECNSNVTMYLPYATFCQTEIQSSQ